ncbi:MAG: hypothetical protein RBR53_02400 [Desulforegulaceae bacterium]|nr:hypothetical protein [Desulforegulaceae bacterium]
MKKNILKLFFLIYILSLLFSCSSKSSTPVTEFVSQADQHLIRGNELLKQGNYDNAGTNFLKSYTKYSLSDDLEGCGASLVGLGITLFNQQREEEAYLVLNKAENYFSFSKNPQDILSFYITKALLFIEKQKFDQAFELLKNSESKGSTDKRLAPSLAFLEIKRNNFEKAKNYLNKKEDTSFYYYVSGIYELETKNYETALINLEKALLKDKTQGNISETASDLEALSRVYLETKDYKKSENYLLRAIKVYILINKIDKANKLIEKFKEIPRDKNHDMNLENFFIELWINK